MGLTQSRSGVVVIILTPYPGTVSSIRLYRTILRKSYVFNVFSREPYKLGQMPEKALPIPDCVQLATQGAIAR
jgi:hypothetical protein